MHNESLTSLETLYSGYTVLADKFELSPWSVFEVGIIDYLDLIREWNDFSSLVSSGDLGERLFGHVADSLSLIPFFHAQGSSYEGYVDIGSGGGFPAIPIKLALPQSRCFLVERSSRKVSFLKKVVGKCGLSLVKVVLGNFPDAVDDTLGGGIITARSVEKPELIAPAIASFMLPGSLYLCQSGELSAFSGPGYACNVPALSVEGNLFDFGELTCIRRL